MERTYFIYRTPMGRVAIESDGAAITHFAFGPVQLAGRQHATALTNRASKLGGYAFGPTVKKFLLDLEAKNR